MNSREADILASLLLVARSPSCEFVDAHEFGHATGVWEHLTGTTLCSTAGSGVYFHTMCRGQPSGSDWDSEWRKSSLETHDVHTFENAYP